MKLEYLHTVVKIDMWKKLDNNILPHPVETGWDKMSYMQIQIFFHIFSEESLIKNLH